jgi:hypothetical protein
MEQNKTVETVFFVSVFNDGTFLADLEQPENKIEVKRTATVYDVLTISQALVKEIEASQLTDRIVVSLLQVLQAAVPPKPADAVKDALKDRGIDPESVTPAN